MRILTACAALLMLAAPACAAEGDAKKTFLDAASAGVDYQLQGEYVGEYMHSNQNMAKVGVQVIAKGDGKFNAVGYEGGLPGAGWDKKTKFTAEGTLAEGKVAFKCEKGTATLEDGVFKIFDPSGTKLVGSAKKTERTSPTLGLAAPEGAVVLFDGTSADAWQGGKLTEDKLLAEGCKTKGQFKDFTLHLEFRLPFMPSASGQGRANSGCYLQDRYEVQILDSFGLAGKDNECGGIYQQKDSDVNMCLPPLVWQTYDIDFTAAKFDESGKKTANAKTTIKLNGVPVHENFEFTKQTPGGKNETAEPGSFQLQNHGNPVRFRNIWVVEKK